MSNESIKLTDDTISFNPFEYLGRLILCALVIVSFYVIYYSVELQFKDTETVQAENDMAVFHENRPDEENVDTITESIKGTEKDPVILIVFNGNEYYQEASNLFTSIKQSAPDRIKSIIVGTSDKESDWFARTNGLRSVSFKANDQSGDFGTFNFNVFMKRKVEAIIYLLRQGHHVLYNDTDIVWLKDPVTAIRKDPKFKSSDIIFQNDAGTEKDYFPCAGFMYCKPTKTAISIFLDTLTLMDRGDFMKAKGGHDQTAIIEIIKKYPNKWTCLSKCDFPNGARYFKHDKSFMQSCKNKDAYIVHVNYFEGTKMKEKMLRSAGLWFI